MTGPSNLTNSSALLVIDTSTAINLNATGCAAEILRVLPLRVHMTDIAIGELSEDKRSGREDAKLVRQLIGAGLVSELSLGPTGLTHFEGLVIGPGIETLDDGEASTIALALEKRGIAVIDERKANRICGERFPELALASTIDLLSHDAILAALGQPALETAIFNALQGARMRVLTHHTDWVVTLIGRERAQSCSSLPRTKRFA